MNIKNKVFAAVSLLAVFVAPVFASAQTVPSSAATTASLQEQIALLLAEIQQLQTQLNSQNSTSGWCYDFNANFGEGGRGTDADVRALQTALAKDGESVNATGAFDDQTAAAVVAFQQKYATQILAPYGLTNGTGYVGVSTRAELNSLYGCILSGLRAHLIADPLPPAPSISVASPSAGQSFAPGSTMNIQWTSANNGVGLIYLVPTVGSVTWQVYGERVDGDPTNYSGSYVYSIPTTIPAGSYSLQFYAPTSDGSNNNQGALIGQSGIFTISQLSSLSTQSALTMSSPAGGEQWQLGTTQTIKWSDSSPSSNSEYSVFISEENLDGTDINGTSHNIGTVYGATQLSWNVGSTSDGTTLPTGSNYYVQIVKQRVQGDTHVISAAPFTITSAVSAAITVAPASLSFTVAQNGMSPSQDLTITLPPGIAWSVSTDPPSNSSNSWLATTYLFQCGNTACGNGSVHVFVVAYSGLAVGTYNGSVVISGNFKGSPITVPVTLTVTAAPTITSITPSTATFGQTITINGTGLASANEVWFNSYGTGGGMTVNNNGTSVSIAVPANLGASCSGFSCGNPETGTYQVAVSNANGKSNALPLVVTATTPLPTVTFSASPATVVAGQSTVLTWSSTNATACTASSVDSSWSGSVATAGSKSITPPNNPGLLPYNVAYTISCSGSGGTNSNSTTVNVVAPAAPSQVQGVSATISGSSVTLQWTVPAVGTGQSPLGVFNIYRSTSSSATPGLIAQAGAEGAASGSTLSFTDKNLSGGTYFYTVAAQDTTGSIGPVSNQVSVTVGGVGVSNQPSSNLATVEVNMQGLLSQLANILKGL